MVTTSHPSLLPLIGPSRAGEQPPGVLTVLLTGGEPEERDRLTELLLEQGAAVCTVGSLVDTPEVTSSDAEGTGPPFDVLVALCGGELGVEDVLERSAMALQVVAVRAQTWTAAELDSALHVGNVLLLDGLPT